MIKLALGKNSYSFPEYWHELKPQQYLLLCQQLFDYINEKISIDEARARWFCSMIGIEFKPKDDKNDLLWENIYRISREFTFFTKIEYSKSISGIDKDLRKKLYKYPPEEINSDEPMLRWAKKLKYQYILDATFAKNLLPSIQVGEKRVYGYRCKLIGNLLDTGLTAQQFIDAGTALDEYSKSKDESHLDLLISILYKSELQQLKKLDPVTKFAVLLNYQAFVSFLIKKTKYSIIWHREPGKKSNKNKNRYEVGAGESLYSMAKLGYGTIEELSEINLMRYLDLLLKNINDSVNTLDQYKVSIVEIAERTGLSVLLVNEILNK